LIDLHTFAQVDLRATSSYHYRAAEARRKFKVIVGAHQFLNRARAEVVPLASALAANYPNPFNASTTIGYQLAQEGSVELRVYNLVGQHIRTLVHERQKAGFFQTSWDGKDEGGNEVGSGLYFFVLRSGGLFQSRRALLMR